MKYKYLYLIVALFTVLGNTNLEASVLTGKDSKVIVDNILSLNNENLNSKTKLKKYKERFNLLLKYQNKSKIDKSIGPKKVYLLLIFSAYQSNDVQSNEIISQSFLPIFETYPEVFLRILSEHGFLIDSTCEAISGFFDYHKKTKNELSYSEFKKRYKSQIEKVLASKDVNSCLNWKPYIPQKKESVPLIY